MDVGSWRDGGEGRQAVIGNQFFGMRACVCRVFGDALRRHGYNTLRRTCWEDVFWENESRTWLGWDGYFACRGEQRKTCCWPRS